MAFTFFSSCGVMCRCTIDEIYEHSFNAATADGQLDNYRFPEQGTLNISITDNKIIVDDTCTVYLPNFVAYEHFTYVYLCRFGKLSLISSSSEQFPEQYLNSNY
jgi:hypothetical protein